MHMGYHVSEQWKTRLEGFYVWLTTPVHASSLCLFRLVYAYVMMAQILKWSDMFEKFQETVYRLHYPGVGWVVPVSPATGHLMLFLCFVSSVAVAIGFMTRIASVMNALLFGYLFHICHSHYNNHYVLMCHINFVGCFVNWGAWGSIDALIRMKQRVRLESTVPRWHLWLMQLLFCVPYFWGAVAKMNGDWLFRAQPLIDWFGHREGFLYHQWWFPWFIAWSGMAYDLTISFLLMWKKTRYIFGFPGAIFFNFGNKIMFNIGVFPFAMIASLVLFINPDDPAKWWAILFKLPKTHVTSEEMPGPSIPSEDDNSKYAFRKSKPWQKWYVMIFVGSFLFFHIAYPLRHFFLYASNPSWTEEGHTGAWHMKLRSKKGWVYLETVELDGHVMKLMPSLDRYVSHSQLKKIEPRPDDLLSYVSRMKQIFDEAGRPLQAIQYIYVDIGMLDDDDCSAHSCFSLNSNPRKELFMSNVNLLDHIGEYEWIGTTAVNAFIYAQDEAPPCHQHNPSKDPEVRAEMESNLRQLYHDAHIFSGREIGMKGHARHFVYHITGNQTDPGRLIPAYLWNAQ